MPNNIVLHVITVKVCSVDFAALICENNNQNRSLHSYCTNYHWQCGQALKLGWSDLAEEPRACLSFRDGLPNGTGPRPRGP